MKTQGGFSLLEVLAAFALLALLLLGVYSGVRSTTLSVGRGSGAVARLDEVRAAREFLRRELASATALPWKVDEDGVPTVFEGDAGYVRFVAVLPGYLGKVGPQVIGVRRSDDAGGGHDLGIYLEALPTTQSLTAQGVAEPLLTHIRSVRIRYAPRDTSQWQDRWTDPMVLPAAIEITVVPEEGVEAWPPLVVSPRQGADAVNVRGAALGFTGGRP